MTAADSTLQDEMCTASEEAQRLAQWHSTGRITAASQQPPFSCSAAGSSADPLEPPQGTQLGTVLEQAAAIISYSQVHERTSPVKTQPPPPRLLLPQAVLHVHTQKQGMPKASPPTHASQTASAAAMCPANVLNPTPCQALLLHKHDATAEAAAAHLAAGSDQRREECDGATAVQGDALQPGNSASQSGSVLGDTQPNSAPVPASADAPGGVAGTAAPAQESQTQAGAPALAAPVLQGGSAHQTLAGEESAPAAAVTCKQAPAGVPAAKSGLGADCGMSQETDISLEDIAPTEVQLPWPAPLLHAAVTKAQSLPASDTAPAPATDRPRSPTESAWSAEHEAKPEASPELAVGTELVPQDVALVPSHEMLGRSPTQDLQLQLTYLEPELAGHHAEPAAEADSKQLCLQRAAQMQPPEAHADPDMNGDSCWEDVSSPARLDLNLDTQLPDPPADKAGSLCRAAAGGQKSPQPCALRRGWWNQPWSVAQNVEDADSLPAGLASHSCL